MKIVPQNQVPASLPVIPAAVADRQGITGQEGRHLADLLAVLGREKWLIGSILLTAFGVGLLYASYITPVYKADAMLLLDEPQDEGKRATDGLSTLFNRQGASETEMKIIGSDRVLSGVVRKQHLDISMQPVYFPLIGKAWAHYQAQRTGLAPPFLGLTRFAWGNERASVESLTVPMSWIGKPLKLVAGGHGQYLLYGPDGTLVLHGTVGSRVVGGQGASQLSLVVSELQARPGTQFTLTKLSEEAAIRNLRERLTLSEPGQGQQLKSGIILLSVEGTQPQRITSTLNTILQAYLIQDMQRQHEDARSRFAFFAEQLPRLKLNRDRAQNALTEYRISHGTVNTTVETQTTVAQVADVEKDIMAIELQQAELRQKFTDQHPALIALNQKLKELEARRTMLKGRITTLPNEQQATLRLEQDAQVANDLYTMMRNKAQELQIILAATPGHATVIDQAHAQDEPIRPQLKPILSISGLIGLLIGALAAFIRQGLRRQKDITAWLGEIEVPYRVIVPHSKLQQVIANGLRSGGSLPAPGASCEDSAMTGVRPDSQLPILATANPKDIAIENLRGLRNYLLQRINDQPGNIASILGPSPGMGKSFVLTNLAYLAAAANKRVLIIDGDMRRGNLHRYFGQVRTPGLAEVIQHKAAPASAIRASGLAEYLDFLPCGEYPDSPSELLLHASFQQLLEDASRQYDLVIIDTPPVLAVSDGLIIGRYAAVNLLLLRAGQVDEQQFDRTMSCLQQEGVEIAGIVVNDVSLRDEGQTHSAGQFFQYTY